MISEADDKEEDTWFYECKIKLVTARNEKAMVKF